ncbi:hypothetical protein GCM10020256_01950 [Streptomyces thermocoprophilus]
MRVFRIRPGDLGGTVRGRVREADVMAASLTGRFTLAERLVAALLVLFVVVPGTLALSPPPGAHRRGPVAGAGADRAAPAGRGPVGAGR